MGPGIRLPKLQLQKFNGEPSWSPSFWKQFRGTIDENVTLSKIEKFQHLRAVLEVLAFAAIDGPEATELVAMIQWNF